jgi:hypothetical protein
MWGLFHRLAQWFDPFHRPRVNRQATRTPPYPLAATSGKQRVHKFRCAPGAPDFLVAAIGFSISPASLGSDVEI